MAQHTIQTVNKSLVSVMSLEKSYQFLKSWNKLEYKYSLEEEGRFQKQVKLLTPLELEQFLDNSIRQSFWLADNQEWPEARKNFSLAIYVAQKYQIAVSTEDQLADFLEQVWVYANDLQRYEAAENKELMKKIGILKQELPSPQTKPEKKKKWFFCC